MWTPINVFLSVSFSKRAKTQRASETFDGPHRGSLSSVISARTLSSFGREQRLRSTSGASEMGDGEDIDSDDGTMFWMDLDKLGNLFSHQGSSFFLRIGALCG